MKKVISLMLVFVLVFSTVGIFASAENDAYTPDYDRDTPVIIIHGIGQNDTYILDDEGNRKTDKNGNYITGWPLSIDIAALLKEVVPHLLLSIFTRKDSGLKDSMKKGAYDLLYAVHKDSEGNYENDVEVPCYRCPMSEIPEDVRATYYNRIPVESSAEIIGEDNLYYFGYDSLGDIEETTRLFHEFVTETVLPQTGADKVCICPISLGGTIAVNYIENYPEDYKYIKKIVYVVPAIDGSDIVGDLLLGDLSTFDSSALYGDLLVRLLGDNYTAYLVALLMRIVPVNVLKNALVGLADGAIEALLRNSTQLWSLCPTKHYAEAREKWISDDEHSLIASKVDNYMKARANFEKNTNALIDAGVSIYNIACYDVEFFPICKDYKTTNADGIIQAKSTSMGATFADLGTTLGEDYEAKGTYCSNPAHNHLSPDGMVDPTTGLIPDTTWYFKGQSHENLASNDVVLRLATELMSDDNFVDVYSNPVAFPQYNGARSVKKVNLNIAAWNEADKTNIPEEKVAEIENAIKQVELLKAETVIDTQAWKDAELQLENALVLAGVIESSQPTTFEALLTKLFKFSNNVILGVQCE